MNRNKDMLYGFVVIVEHVKLFPAMENLLEQSADLELYLRNIILDLGNLHVMLSVFACRF